MILNEDKFILIKNTTPQFLTFFSRRIHRFPRWMFHRLQTCVSVGGGRWWCECGVLMNEKWWSSSWNGIAIFDCDWTHDLPAETKPIELNSIQSSAQSKISHIANNLSPGNNIGMTFCFQHLVGIKIQSRAVIAHATQKRTSIQLHLIWLTMMQL